MNSDVSSLLACGFDEWPESSIELVMKRYISDHSTTIDSWLRAVATSVTRYYPLDKKSEWSERYFQLMKRRIFLPTSAALHNSTKQSGCLSGCIVLPLEPEIRRFYSETLPMVARMLGEGIGVGVDLSILPPRLSSDPVSQRAYPGPVELLSSLVSACDGPMEYAGLKRAAFMAGLSAAHPDVFEFICCKRDRSLKNVNVSVTLDREFNEAYREAKGLKVWWTDQSGIRSSLKLSDLRAMEARSKARSVPAPDLEVSCAGAVISKRAGREVGYVLNDEIYFGPQAVLEVIAESAHACGDPGILNLEAINSANPTYSPDSHDLGVGSISITTPCGEQPLLPYEVCHLGSINLAAFVRGGAFDWRSLKSIVPMVVRFMDDIVEVGDNQLCEANEVTYLNRKIGIGIMGLADVLAELEIPYESQDAMDFASSVMGFVNEESKAASESLAAERGAFPNFSGSRFAQGPLRRHATLTTLAPTGHISTLAACSTAIEPYFSIAYVRNACGKRIELVGSLARKLEEIDYSIDQWIDDARQSNPKYEFDGTLRGLEAEVCKFPEMRGRLARLKSIFKTALEIPSSAHLEMTISLQKCVENGISKTINLPHDCGVSSIRRVLEEVIHRGLKGITVFRDGCLNEQALERLAGCPGCGRTQFLKVNDCGGLSCDAKAGGCGFDSCALVKVAA